jgi:hypothetical protein
VTVGKWQDSRLQILMNAYGLLTELLVNVARLVNMLHDDPVNRARCPDHTQPLEHRRVVAKFPHPLFRFQGRLCFGSGFTSVILLMWSGAKR